MTESNNTDKLAALLQFDPAKPVGTKTAFDEALAEVQKEEAEVAKAKAKDLLKNALDLQRKKQAAKKQFLAEDKKFDKQLGKLLNNLSAMANGTEIPTEETGNE